MPRTARKKSNTGIYHVTLRGINRQQIFIDAEDAERFMQAVMDSRAISDFSLYAYCLMGNHIHLVLKEGNEPLEQIIKRIGVRFVYWYNWKYRRSETQGDGSAVLTVSRGVVRVSRGRFC